MKSSLQLQIGQQLKLTPQLQQAIRLLQLSTIELNQEIQQALEANPMLEIEDEHETNQTEETEPSASQQTENKSAENNSDSNDIDIDKNADIPQELVVDTDWDQVFDTPSTASSGKNAESSSAPESWHTEIPDLHDLLREQARLVNFSDNDSIVANTLIDAINKDGLLDSSIEEIYTSFDQSDLKLDTDDTYTIEEMLVVLHRIQQFDPLGVGASDLQECLLIQLGEKADDTPYLKQTQKLVEEHFDLLAKRDYQKILSLSQLDKQTLRETLALIQTLNPRPGSQIDGKLPEYIVPDVIVRKDNQRWRIELNQEIVPKLRINQQYESLIKRANNSPENNYLKDNLQEARWFLKSIQSRNETLLRVANFIVRYQCDFLEHGEIAMKPLILNDVASQLELHESTISRVTTSKYMLTPRGIFELKYFFSSHLNTEAGGECSSTAIRALIKQIIDAENINKPMSDQKISLVLQEQGINVARRTVAKYRESLGIGASSERKSIL